jgi:protein-S-isoprenylcysteine O-methyltransferase Ste14
VKTIDKNTYDLKTKTLFGFLQLIVMLGLCLFGPPWSFDFWQAWVYLIIFVMSAAIITIYLWKKDPKLLERRVEAGPGAEKEKTQKIIQLFASILFFSILIIPSLDHRFEWSNVPLYIVIVGDIFVALGFYLIFLVFRENTFAAATIEISTDQKVITTGTYSIVRHPMYIGSLIMLLGTSPALGSWWGLLIFIPFTMIISLRLLDEEKFLLKNLPGYKEYCQKVRYRLIPLLW